MTNEDLTVTELSVAPTAQLAIRYSPVDLIKPPTGNLGSSNKKIALPDETVLCILELAVQLEPRMIRLECHHDKCLKTIIVSDSPAQFHITWKLRRLLLTSKILISKSLIPSKEVMFTYKPYFRLPESCFSAEIDTLHISTQLYTMLRTEVPWRHNFRHMTEHVKRLALDHTSTNQSIFLSRLRLDFPKLEQYSVRFDTSQNLTDHDVDRWVEIYRKLGREIDYTTNVQLDGMMRTEGVTLYFKHKKFPFGHVAAGRLSFLRSASRMSQDWIPPVVSKTGRLSCQSGMDVGVRNSCFHIKGWDGWMDDSF
ncbi:uncharacterized protein EAF01_003237 [Botrytis porri]|uniref:Uncharacterized protein n=1 Tax=Botrytis porri TaxID=87229 RepID=A0A4Z1KTC4_9HELO|nr:uncharacterized protein EAF01_003237 [Botrytis porri]KAF7909519.1 hypothetical protein EAF01_003237 [Botrytis porri]TGO87275.1 hypothetical protein BPOR_0237g00140 [Botrytis porri]